MNVPELEGVLPVHKPAGWTSHDVVAKLRGLLRIKKIGHAGTLDPFVTGVLPLAIGRATRMIEYLQDMPKAYTAQMIVGYATDTEDSSGTVIERCEHVALDRKQVEDVLATFVGTINQVPPMYSAVKVGGKRLYELARQGIEVERKAREVTIHELQLESFAPDDPYPKLVIRVVCSKGTYIRTLCKDIGSALGYPAVMGELVRTVSCGISLDQCLDLEEIQELHRAGKLAEHIIPTGDALPHLTAVELDHHEAKRLLQGQKVNVRSARIDPDGHNVMDKEAQLVRVFTPDGVFIGICRLKHHRLIPHKMFHT